jgi:hypothetical protein
MRAELDAFLAAHPGTFWLFCIYVGTLAALLVTWSR